eukprot:COSAG01_NODE_391_length_17672_cov_4.507369_2_plen_189_part_00
MLQSHTFRNCAQIGFTVEMFIRIIAMGWWDRTGSGVAPNIMYDPRYMNDPWNQLDFFVVVSSWINVLVDVTGMELPLDMSTLRALRILRVLKAFKNIQGIRQILGTIGQALPYSVNVMAFLVFLFTINGIIGVQMFRGGGTQAMRVFSIQPPSISRPRQVPVDKLKHRAGAVRCNQRSQSLASTSAQN